MRTRYLLNTCLLTALLISGFTLPFQAEAWNGGHYYGYRNPRPHFLCLLRSAYPIYPSMGYNYYPYYRPYYRYPLYRHSYRHFYRRGHPYPYP